MGNPQLAPGGVFASRFEIDRPVGSGGMGTVYRARDRFSGEWVALKLLHAGGGNAEESERFAREAHILAELRHPTIVSHIAHGQTAEGQRFLAMEWLEGEDLGQRLLRGPLPLHDCFLIFRQATQALALAHGRGVIHRDLKPSNLFLVAGGRDQVKLLDFGIARRLTSATGLTRTGAIVGTPEYMAPEQARGSRDLLPAADLFALGCVMYECLTGVAPFVADHIAAVLVRILFEEPVAIVQRRSGVPDALQQLIMRLLAKEPAQRPADAIALQSELLVLGEPTATESDAALAHTVAFSLPPTASPFAKSDQSLFSIVLATPPVPAQELGASGSGGDPLLDAKTKQALVQALQALGVTPDFLANGTLVLAVPAIGGAHDQVTLAARAALLIKSRWPQSVVSLATGRGSLNGRTAVGEVVEQAARARGRGNPLTPNPGEVGIFVDTLSAKLLEGRFAQTPQPDGALVLSEVQERDASRPLLGRPTPCVGRDYELGTLESQLDACIEDNRSCVMLLTAPPGVGKSRLRHEFLRRVEGRSAPVTVILGRGDLLVAGAAYGILGRALRGLCDLSGAEPLAVQRERLSTRVGRHVASAEQQRVSVFVGELCGVPFPESDSAPLRAARQDPKSLPEQLRQAMLDFLAAECQAAPVLLVLDDLHWGDELTVALVDQALRDLRDAPLFVLALARPEIHTTFPKLWHAHKLQDTPLKSLSKRACERLVQQMLGKQVSAKAMAWVVEQCAGNALFLEETVRYVPTP